MLPREASVAAPGEESEASVHHLLWEEPASVPASATAARQVLLSHFNERKCPDLTVAILTLCCCVENVFFDF